MSTNPSKTGLGSGRSIELAVDEAFAARARVDEEELPQARAQVIEAELKRERLTKFIESALPLLSPEVRAAYTAKLNELAPEAATARGGPIYANVVSLFKTSDQKEWSATVVQEALSAKGISTEQKQIHNVLSYLERDGLLKRVSRGRYLYMGAGIITSDELLDSLRPPWRRGINDES